MIITQYKLLVPHRLRLNTLVIITIGIPPQLALAPMPYPPLAKMPLNLFALKVGDCQLVETLTPLQVMENSKNSIIHMKMPMILLLTPPQSYLAAGTIRLPTTKAHTGTGGLAPPTMRHSDTSWTSIIQASIRRVISVKGTGSLSAASPNNSSQPHPTSGCNIFQKSATMHL